MKIRFDAGVSRIVGWKVDPRGEKIPQSQQDSFIVSEKLGLFVVFDGVGGHAGGEVASAMAATLLEESFTLLIQVLEVEAAQREPYRIQSEIEAALRRASRAIYHAGRRDPALDYMATTVSGVFFYEGTAYYFNVGDSRCYREQNGEFEQMTRDHSYVADQLYEGLITAEEARNHPDRGGMHAALGFRDISDYVDVRYTPSQPGDGWIICTDGLVDYADPDRWEVVASSQLRRGICTDEIATTLTNLTTAEAGIPLGSFPGEYYDYNRCDNTTVIALRICR
ncbi:MAG: serine/threonine-protein phosphatase [Candidatus Magasanikbacteria bacterium]|jgi:PPM family protein phosphatase|nr:serine/threonine-protein phosphatase [Candidatus Magasanikbacteria bacterium]